MDDVLHLLFDVTYTEYEKKEIPKIGRNEHKYRNGGKDGREYGKARIRSFRQRTSTFVTNTPLSITAGDRGTVALAQELSVEMMVLSIASQRRRQIIRRMLLLQIRNWQIWHFWEPRRCFLYKLPPNHTDDHVEAMLAKLKTEDANVIVYPYLKSTTSASTAQQTIANWVKAMQEEEGKNITAVLTNYVADSQYVINNVQE